MHSNEDEVFLIAYMSASNKLIFFLFVSWLFQILTSAKGSRARMGASAQIWLPTIPANAQESTWGGTVNPVSAHVPFSMFFFCCFYCNYPFIQHA